MSKEKNKVKAKKYFVYDPNKQSSLGLWIIPLLVLLLIGFAYLAIFMTYNQMMTVETTINTNNAVTEIKFNQLDILEDRSHSGPPLNFNETTWGKDNPFE